MEDKKNPLFRWRYWAMLALPLLVIVVTAFLSPDGWRDPLVKMAGIAWSAIAVALAHSGRKALFDYAKGREAWQKSLENPIGAGLSFLGLCLVTAVLCFGLMGLARAQPVPDRAVAMAPLLVQEIDGYWPSMPYRSYLGSLIEKETCITLKHKGCWSTTARLKTSREEGAGLGQITRAYDANGVLRFDALAETKAMAPEALYELSWANVYTRADLGVRAILVKLKDCDGRFAVLKVSDPFERMSFCDAAYNGGLGGVQNDRKLCNLTKGCDASKWFGNVANTSNKSRAKWQGYGLSAFDINRTHVLATVPLEPRRKRYVPYLGD